MSYDNWKTYTPCQHYTVAMCSECGTREAEVEMWVEDENDRGCVRMANPCFQCANNLKAVGPRNTIQPAA